MWTIYTFSLCHIGSRVIYSRIASELSTELQCVSSRGKICPCTRDCSTDTMYYTSQTWGQINPKYAPVILNIETTSLLKWINITFNAIWSTFFLNFHNVKLRLSYNDRNSLLSQYVYCIFILKCMKTTYCSISLDLFIFCWNVWFYQCYSYHTSVKFVIDFPRYIINNYQMNIKENSRFTLKYNSLKIHWHQHESLSHVLIFYL